MSKTTQEDKELCGRMVYWWDGEYEGQCELPKNHPEPFHYDGISYWDEYDNEQNEAQEKLQALIEKATIEARNGLVVEIEDTLKTWRDEHYGTAIHIPTLLKLIKAQAPIKGRNISTILFA